MMTQGMAWRQRRWIRAWAPALAWLGLIYGSLPLVRGPIEALRARGMLALTVGLGFALAAGLVLRWLWSDLGERRPWALALAPLLIGAYGALTMALDLPEERAHFLEYGVMALLFLRAWRPRPGRHGPLVAAALLTALAGLGDELIQGLLPSRVFDVRDILMNALAAWPPLLGYALATRCLGRDDGLTRKE